MRGWPWVTLQIAAVMMLAAPSMSLPTALDGSRIAAATWAQLRCARPEGRYWACGKMYWLPMSRNGNEPPEYLANSACCGGVGCCR